MKHAPRKPIKVPKFRSEKQERAFWSRVDLSKHFAPADFSSASFPDLKPSSRSISIRLPEHLLIRLKEQANELDIPYQSLLKQHIASGITRRHQRRSSIRA